MNAWGWSGSCSIRSWVKNDEADINRVVVVRLSRARALGDADADVGVGVVEATEEELAAPEAAGLGISAPLPRARFSARPPPFSCARACPCSRPRGCA